MVSHFTNINNTSNHLLPWITDHTIGMKTQVLAWGQAQKCGRVELFTGIPILHFWSLDLQRQYRYK
jgi:hypothetical protein